MAWTAPRTWVDNEVVTDTHFNQQIRDNFLILKTSISDIGKWLGFSAATLVSLSGTNLTAVAMLASNNTFTAGRHNFNGGAASRFVVPVGTDKFDGISGNKTPGSMWVEGNYLHHVDSVKAEWRYLGTSNGSPAGARVGSVWVEGTTVHYIDSSGVERIVTSSVAGHADAAAVPGSMWVETYTNWIAEPGTQAYQGHLDTHTDGTSHSDLAHTDTGTPHSDLAHSDATSPHQDHTDGHGDHGDGGHADTSGHADHTDHADVAHLDHNDHGDVGHSDHTDHGDVAHADLPEFIGTV